MYAVDFEYDGQYLSDYGFIICKFDYSNGSEVVETGSTITFDKVSRSGGKSNSLVSSKYEECVQASFDICKNPDIYDPEDMIITNDEYRDIIRWLNRREFLKFQVLYDDYGHEPCFYNASFNIDKINIAEKLCGLRLSIETDKPFGYGEEQVFNLNFDDTSKIIPIYDVSDEIGYLYPFVQITCKSDGDLSIHNDLEKCVTTIKNCLAGEIITLHGDTQIIISNNKSHDICNDFNYDFFKIGNTFDNRNNNIRATMPCDILIKYCPIIKDSI